jgi:hypothetical protein
MLENWPGIGYLEFLTRFLAFGVVVELKLGKWKTFRALRPASVRRLLSIPRSSARKGQERQPRAYVPLRSPLPRSRNREKQRRVGRRTRLQPPAAAGECGKGTFLASSLSLPGLLSPFSASSTPSQLWPLTSALTLAVWRLCHDRRL